MISAFILSVMTAYAQSQKALCQCTVGPRSSVMTMGSEKDTAGGAVDDALGKLYEKLLSEKPAEGRGTLPVQKTMEDCLADAETYKNLAPICKHLDSFPAGNRQACLNTLQCTIGAKPYLRTARKISNKPQVDAQVETGTSTR